MTAPPSSLVRPKSPEFQHFVAPRFRGKVGATEEHVSIVPEMIMARTLTAENEDEGVAARVLAPPR
jgi:hypothetical protein